ncbi:MAG: hypothetical protein IT204_17250 [Fimbriimonadaceae bacterium]|nr:hypothetical protein [Fimbriimonadaceae bacterium]
MSTLATAQLTHPDPSSALDEHLCTVLRQLAAQSRLPGSCRTALEGVFRALPGARQQAWRELLHQDDFAIWLRAFTPGERLATEFRRGLLQRLATVARPPQATPVALARSADVPAVLARLAGVSNPDANLYGLLAAANCLPQLPAQLAEAHKRGQLAEWVRSHRDRLDRALYTPFRAVQLADELAALLTTSEAEALATWLWDHQAAGRRALGALGLERVDPTPGSPFEPGEVVPKAGAAPRPTTRLDWHDRVAEVSPGDGGYRLAGRMVCPAMARRYAATV